MKGKIPYDTRNATASATWSGWHVFPPPGWTGQSDRTCSLYSRSSVARHAACTGIVVQLDKTNKAIRFIIEDDGKGFDLNNTRAFGNGLQNMKSRMEQVEGSYSITSTPGKGTITTISIAL